jgi:superfamily II DNA or RNA helicase
MSCWLPLEEFSDEQKEQIFTDLKVSGLETNYGKADDIYAFEVINHPLITDDDIQFDDEIEYLQLPFSYASHYTPDFPNDEITFEHSVYTFVGKLKSIQEEIQDEVFYLLNTRRSVMLSLYCGAGKTIYTIYLCSRLKYKPVMIICHRVNIIDNWQFSINKVCPDARVMVLSAKSSLCYPDGSYPDFYIINITAIPKFKIDSFHHVAVVVVDEAHTICTDKSIQHLFHFTPRYTIGLTATPDRSDGRGKLLDFFFGGRVAIEEDECVIENISRGRVTRKLWRPFNVYTYETDFKPITQQSEQGRLDWHSVLAGQAQDDERNNLIVAMVKYFRTRNFLILCKRKDQSQILLQKLRNHKEDVDIFIESSRVFRTEARILISTYSKSGVGFDHPKLDALIVAGDVLESFDQYLFRVFRRDDVMPMVFDLIDKNFVLKNHFYGTWKKPGRTAIYRDVGGEIRNFKMCFPEFLTWRKYRNV